MPKEILDLVDRKVIFKVQVKPGQNNGFSGAYTVMKLTTNSEIIDKYGAEFLESQVNQKKIFWILYIFLQFIREPNYVLKLFLLQEKSVLSKLKGIEQAEFKEVFK